MDFHENWCGVMSTSLYTEVKEQWATLLSTWIGDCTTVLTVLLVSLMTLQLVHVDQNIFDIVSFEFLI